MHPSGGGVNLIVHQAPLSPVPCGSDALVLTKGCLPPSSWAPGKGAGCVSCAHQLGDFCDTVDKSFALCPFLRSWM